MNETNTLPVSIEYRTIEPVLGAKLTDAELCSLGVDGWQSTTVVVLPSQNLLYTFCRPCQPVPASDEAPARVTPPSRFNQAASTVANRL